jgi:hypothetical protein
MTMTRTPAQTFSRYPLHYAETSDHGGGGNNGSLALPAAGTLTPV